MDIRTPLLALALLPALAAHALPVNPADLPAGFVQTWHDHALKGAVRRVWLQEDTSPSFTRTLTEDEYSASGILVRHMVTSGKGRHSSAESWRLRLEKNRVKEIVYSPARFGSAFIGGSAQPVRHDDEGRVTIMAGGPDASPAAVHAAASGPGAPTERITAIRYELNRQVHEVFRHRTLVHRLEFEFAPNGRLRRSSCTEGRCGGVPTQEFGPDGPLRRELGGSETRWYYEGGVPVAMLTRHGASGVVTDQRHYEAYRFDGCGNWIYREQYDAPAGTPGRRLTGTAVRRLEYHSPCPR